MSSHFAMFEEAGGDQSVAVNMKAVRYLREIKGKAGHTKLVFSDDDKGVEVKGDLSEVLAKLGGKDHHKREERAFSR